MDARASMFDNEVAVKSRGTRREKATGWKVPLLFCAVILGIVAVAASFRDSPELVRELPPGLVEQAQHIVIDLDGPDGKLWKERISAAASGFVARDFKDERLRVVVAEALEQERYDVACTAAVLIADEERRNAVFGNVFESAVKTCDSLPWGVFAVRGSFSPEQVEEWSARLEARWRMCGGV